MEFLCWPLPSLWTFSTFCAIFNFEASLNAIWEIDNSFFLPPPYVHLSLFLFSSPCWNTFIKNNNNQFEQLSGIVTSHDYCVFCNFSTSAHISLRAIYCDIRNSEATLYDVALYHRLSTNQRSRHYPTHTHTHIVGWVWRCVFYQLIDYLCNFKSQFDAIRNKTGLFNEKFG